MTEKRLVLDAVTECLTEDGNPYDADNATYEAAEATATVAVLMELASKYFQPLPDSLFQLQGAFISLSDRGNGNMPTKAVQDLCQRVPNSPAGVVPNAGELAREWP